MSQLIGPDSTLSLLELNLLDQSDGLSADPEYCE